MKKEYQKPWVSLLYFEERSIMTESTEPELPLYTEQEMEELNLAIRNWRDINWE